MTLMPELHDALARAVATRPGVKRWRRPGRTGLLAVGAVILTGSALAATGGWQPVLGTNRGGHPKDTLVPLPPAQSAQLGVLRRAQTAADRGPGVRAVLPMLDRDEINGVHTNEIRLLRDRPDGVAILVPAERVGRHDPGYTSSIQRQVLCLMTSARVTSKTVTVKDPHGTAHTARTYGGLIAGQSCGGVPQLRANQIAMSTRSNAGWIYSGLVPDGVARVIVRRLAENGSLSVPVRENLYEVNIGSDPRVASVKWLDARGRTIGPATVG
jgi:hypothetical protein